MNMKYPPVAKIVDKITCVKHPLNKKLLSANLCKSPFRRFLYDKVYFRHKTKYDTNL